MLCVVHGKSFSRQLYRRTQRTRTFATKLRGGPAVQILIQTQIQSRARGPITRYGYDQRRALGGIPTVLLPPVVFGGLVIALWTWKCSMMVVFQNKIIYMPGLPPNARRETIAEYRSQCSGIEWREVRIKSMDGTKISLAVASVNNIDVCDGRMVYILYFQGNASSIPPRLPFLSPILRMLGDRSLRDVPVRYTMVCCSYRGYWTSKGRPSGKGIAMDAAASLDWIRDDFLEHSGNLTESIPIVIWGQSIGAGVANDLAVQTRLFQRTESKPTVSLQALILETPFISVRAMLETLYPQKWLPYRHLWPFLWNHLDSLKALGLMRERFARAGMESPKVIILEAGKDELVPSEHGKVLQKRCKDVGLSVEKRTIEGAFHTEVMVRFEGRMAVVEAVQNVSRRLFSQSRGEGWDELEVGFRFEYISKRPQSPTTSRTRS